VTFLTSNKKDALIRKLKKQSSKFLKPVPSSIVLWEKVYEKANAKSLYHLAVFIQKNSDTIKDENVFDLVKINKFLEVGKNEAFYQLLGLRLSLSGGLFIIGAGFSAFGYNGNDELIREANWVINDNKDKLCSLCSKQKSSCSTKSTPYNELETIKECGKGLEQQLRNLFKSETLQRDLGEAQLSLANLFMTKSRHNKFGCEHVISLNYDDFLQKAIEKITHMPIPDKWIITRDNGTFAQHGIWKFHGDIRDDGSEWIYPYDLKGRVFHKFEELFDNELKKLPLAIAGYGEAESNIKDKIISRWSAFNGQEPYRIVKGSTKHQYNSLDEDVDVAIKEILRAFNDWQKTTN
jgi:hypothetical protein